MTFSLKLNFKSGINRGIVALNNARNNLIDINILVAQIVKYDKCPK